MALAASEISSYNCPKVSYISPKKVDEREFFMFDYMNYVMVVND